ncbi:MAG: cyclic pyranopterin monophosphate synthase MoaC [Thermodesulfobacteriota bacterium]
MKTLTHFNEKGRARMVDVSEKAVTSRTAVAKGLIRMSAETMSLIRKGRIKKGDVLAVADCAAVMAAKKTPDIIPMCHPIQITGIDVDFGFGKTVKNSASIMVTVTARCVGPTGIEMEALTAVSAALLTIYDMCKSVDRGMTIEKIRLVEKSGGRSGLWKRQG